MKPKKILLVDDDYEVLEACHLALVDDGHDVIRASNGADAVIAYFKFKPDIVFMDVRMPGIDGYDAFFAIQKRDHDARVVLTSSYELDVKKRKKAYAKSLRGTVSKPLVWDDVEKMIKRHSK